MELTVPNVRAASDFRDLPVNFNINIHKSALRISEASACFSFFSYNISSIDVKG